jgi:hypothetical protein
MYLYTSLARAKSEIPSRCDRATVLATGDIRNGIRLLMETQPGELAPDVVNDYRNTQMRRSRCCNQVSQRQDVRDQWI